MRFLVELKRRNVLRMAGLYLVSSWLVVQVAETILPIFGVPDWVLRSLIILLAIGFVLQIVFDAVGMGGQLLANGMGLSFAFLVDPLRGASTAALGQFYMVLTTLTFLALDGHLALISLLLDGFRGVPPGAAGFGPEQLYAILLWGGKIFSGALQVALPGVTALVIVNLGFGVISRSAPTLNLLAVGFPVTLVLGLAIVMAGLPHALSAASALISEALLVAAELAGSGVPR